MADDELDFWSLVDRLGGSSGDAAVARLHEALTGCPPEAIEAFDRQLRDKLALLEQPGCAALIRELPEVRGSDDAALFVRCAIVAAGQDTFSRVLADPGLVAAGWDISGADLLLGVAVSAYEEVTGDTLVAGEGDGVPPAHLPWTQLIFGGESQLRPRWLWEPFFDHQARRLAADPDWLRWREEQAVEAVWLFPSYRRGAAQAGTERLRVGVRDGVVELHATRDTAHLPPLPTPRAMNREGDWLMGMVAERLRRRRS